jgi:hypothetical protein
MEHFTAMLEARDNQIFTERREGVKKSAPAIFGVLD